MESSVLPATRASQTKAFTTVFLVEMWERFGFYGMAALLVLFMIQKAGFNDAQAYLVWGAFGALNYTAPAIGGWLGDKVLGTRRTMLIGAFIYVVGYLMFALPYDDLSFMYASLAVIVVGGAFFKPNSANLVRRIYEGDEARIDSAFTIYYMSVNIGSTVSILATPWIKDRWGWHAAFAVCCFGMVLGVLNLLMRYQSLAHVGSTPDEQPIAWRRLAVIAAGSFALWVLVKFVLGHRGLAVICVDVASVAVLAIFGYMFATCERSERSGLVAAAILLAQSILFFIFYQQLSTSLTLFALRNVDLVFSLFGVRLFSWSAAQFQALNPIWIMLLSPLLAFVYKRLAENGRDISVAAKYAIGFAAVAAGFFIYALGGRYALDARVSSWFMVWGYGLYSLGELLVSGLGQAMIARYTPVRMSGFMMGAYFVVVGVSTYLGSLVANLAKLPSGQISATESLHAYTTLFFNLGCTATAGTVLSVLLLPLMRRLTQEHGRRNLATPVAQPLAAASE
jgi:proton-dependent oligopeptide transporter, POT family